MCKTNTVKKNNKKTHNKNKSRRKEREKYKRKKKKKRKEQSSVDMQRATGCIRERKKRQRREAGKGRQLYVSADVTCRYSSIHGVASGYPLTLQK